MPDLITSDPVETETAACERHVDSSIFDNLAELSDEINFNKFIIISKHIEENCSGRNNQPILEDVFEAFLGAIFLDNDYEFAKNIIITIIEEHVDFTDLIINDNNYKDQILNHPTIHSF